jgi:GNAT superfamily N-acetyltransferase
VTPAKVRSSAPSDVQACQNIVRGLPEFFTIDVPDKLGKDLALLEFAIVEKRGSGAAEILWAAVLHEHRAHGLGTQLIEQVLDELASNGTKVVLVKTLDAHSGYAPYEATRAFWERCGFVQVDTIDPLPDWQPGNPAAIYVASLAVTRAPVGRAPVGHAPVGRAPVGRQP